MIAKRHTLANALRVAAEQYAADAKRINGEAVIPGEARQSLAGQFERQAVEAIDLADAIEQADSIQLED